MWQVSHGALVAMWVADFVLTSANWAPWHVEQPVVMPAWFITEPVNEVPILWHASQDAGVGMWPVVGFVFTSANWAPWHVAQPVVMPAWFITEPANEAAILWQLSHEPLVGMWPVTGLPVACLPLWHVAQVPALTPA